MKKMFVLSSTLMLSISLYGCSGQALINKLPQPTQPIQPTQPTQSVAPSQGTELNAEEEIRSLVTDFGSRLQNISLLAPQEIVEQSMEENYGDLVSPELLEKWKNDPQNAPGRLTSSPWPDRIEIKSVEKIWDIEYAVKGEIVEITSTEKPGTGEGNRRPVAITVENTDGRWLISDVVMEPYLN